MPPDLGSAELCREPLLFEIAIDLDLPLDEVEQIMRSAAHPTARARRSPSATSIASPQSPPTTVLRASRASTRRQIRAHATIEGETFDTLVLPTGDGRHFIYVAASVRRRLGVERGDSVHAAVEARSATPEPPMPDELRRKLAASSAAEGAWRSLTDGMRRTARRFINDAQDPDVRAWRVHDVLRRAEWHRSGAGPSYPTRDEQPLPAAAQTSLAHKLLRRRADRGHRLF